MSTNELVSVIIPTLNASHTIGRCLSSIRQQTWPYIEIIVVDQGSSDDTTTIVARYEARILKHANPYKFYAPPSSSRNFGSKYASGLYLLHVDADMELEPTLIEECVAKCEREFANAIIIHEYDVGKSFWARCKALERSCYINDPSIEAPRFVTKETFNKIGGYDETISSGEDWDLKARIIRAGFKIAYAERNYIKHNIGALSFSRQIIKKYNYGKTIKAYVRRHKGYMLMQISPIRIAYFRNMNKLLCDPIHTIGFLFMKACENTAAGIGFIIAELSDR